jgi:hypothetical protein
MFIYGHKYESPSVVPNRTSSAMRDVASLIQSIGDLSVSDDVLLQSTIETFGRVGFSQVLEPVSQILDREQPEITSIYTTVLIKTVINNEQLARVCLCILLCVIRCCEEKDKISIPVTITEIQRLTTTASEFKSYPLMKSIMKQVVKRLRPTVRTVPLYIDHSGFSALRDNQKDSVAKQLSQGADTGRTVSVQPIGADEVGLVDELTGDVIFKLREQTSHNTEFKKQCAVIMEEIGNIIPPPIRSEPEPELLEVLLPRQVKALLKTGRVPTQKQKSSYPSISN